MFMINYTNSAFFLLYTEDSEEICLANCTVANFGFDVFCPKRNEPNGGDGRVIETESLHSKRC
jgi:hypothetical protein